MVILLYIQVCLCGLKRHTSSTGSLTTEDSVDVDVLKDLNSSQVILKCFLIHQYLTIRSATVSPDGSGG